MTHSQETKHETGALLSWQRVVVEKTWRTSPYPDTLLPHLAPGIVSSDDFAGFGVGLNLCEKLSQSENKLFDSYGILDNQVGRPTKRYSIKPDTSDNDSQPRSLVSLSDILAHNRFPVIPLTGRLQLALTISCSILQLHDTPWFPTILTSSHIFFLQEHNGPDPAAMYSRPLLLQHLANSAAPPTVHVQYPPEEEEQVVKLEGGLIANRNPTLLSLACLLIEVLLWQPLDSRCTTAGSPAGGAVDLMADFVAAQALMPNVKLMGEECEEAVECCLYEGRGSQRGRGLEDGELYEKVYRGVVPLLEKDLEWRRKK
ncbi:uncharacterized protein B0H64DRAFT_465004 [Chaetomium fimeti]|uniref:DUF7580 domain-containing protein n=1 Tax=Chaetomium fimeti TaxID=1854472 RepID=A0AAE0LPT2_9PEZI|nr:hypothetical protein B0H64DRAFT_465004 [Chaetomium fimeti]